MSALSEVRTTVSNYTANVQETTMRTGQPEGRVYSPPDGILPQTVAALGFAEAWRVAVLNQMVLLAKTGVFRDAKVESLSVFEREVLGKTEIALHNFSDMVDWINRDLAVLDVDVGQSETQTEDDGIDEDLVSLESVLNTIAFVVAEYGFDTDTITLDSLENWVMVIDEHWQLQPLQLAKHIQLHYLLSILALGEVGIAEYFRTTV